MSSRVIQGFLNLVFVAFLFVPPVFPQSNQDLTSGAADQDDKSNSKTVLLGRDNLKYLELSPTERILRSWQYQYQLLEQPYVLVAANGGPTQIIQNPNAWLQQHSILIQLSELFPRTTNLPSLVKAAYANLSDVDKSKTLILGPDICPHSQTTLQCLAGGGSFWGRLFSGASMTLSVAQRDEVQQGVVVPNLTTSQSWGWNGQLDYDPASLFVSASNWKTAVDAISGKKIMSPMDEDVCFKKNKNLFRSGDWAYCEAQFAKPRLDPAQVHKGLDSVAAVAIPRFQLKVLSQFEFIKQGGILVQDPRLQRSLKNMTFTWDLRRLIPSTADRLIIDTTSGIETSAPDNTPWKLCFLKSGSTRNFISLPDDSNINVCRTLALVLGSVEYALACGSAKSVAVGDPILTTNGDANQNAFPAGNKCKW